MKDRIVLFVIGVLIGAVISTGAFYIYTTTAKSCNSNSTSTQMNGGQPPEMPSGQNSENSQPPDKPDGDNSGSSSTSNNNTQESQS